MSVKILSHMVEGLVIMRVINGQERGTVYAGYTTDDGLYYLGMGENVKRAVMDCRQHIADCQPSLKPYQRAIQTQLRDRTAHVFNIVRGEYLIDRPTGRSEKPIALLENGLLILENEGKAAYVVSQWPQAPAPQPEPRVMTEDDPTDPDNTVEAEEPETCDICGGDPALCHPRQVDVDQFTCDNEHRTMRRILR